MAGNAASPQPQRAPQSVPTVRPLGNLPDRGNTDTGRALSYLRNRQGAANTNGRIMPTLENPALMNAANDNDEEAPDEYGAGQRESEARMQAINQGVGEEEQSVDEGYDDYDQGLQQDENEEAFSDGQDQAAYEQERANAFAREQAMAANIARLRAAQEAEAEGGVADEQQVLAEKLAKEKVKSTIKTELSSTGFGFLFVLIWWNYEVFIEKGQPTWKILLVVLLDLLSIFSAIISILWPLILIAMFVIGIGAALPGPLQDAFVSLIGSL